MSSHLPLSGIRIADFSWVIAGPRCTEWLGAMGAEVIKVESRLRPDRLRSSEPFIDGAASLETSVSFNMLNYSKKSCTINLAAPQGRSLARQLIASCDVVIENFSSDAARKMGLTYEQLREANPALIVVSCSGLGRTGPSAEMRAFGKSIHAFSGLTLLTGWPGTPPRGVGTTWTDPLMGSVAVLAILAGIAHVRRTGEGVYFDLSMAETTMAVMAEAFLADDELSPGPQPRGNEDPETSLHDTYMCADGQWIAVTPHGEPERSSLYEVIRRATEVPAPARPGKDDSIGLDHDVRAWCAERPAEECLTVLAAATVCAAPVLSFDALRSDPHVVQRALMARLERPGGGEFIAPKLPWVQTPDPGFRYTPHGAFGQDNDYVFREILGLSTQDIAALTRNSVLA